VTGITVDIIFAQRVQLAGMLQLQGNISSMEERLLFQTKSVGWTLLGIQVEGKQAWIIGQVIIVPATANGAI